MYYFLILTQIFLWKIECISFLFSIIFYLLVITFLILFRIDPNQTSLISVDQPNKQVSEQNEIKDNEGNLSGLRVIFELLIQEKIPLIVHNGIYDILQVFFIFFIYFSKLRPEFKI